MGRSGFKKRFFFPTGVDRLKWLRLILLGLVVLLLLAGLLFWFLPAQLALPLLQKRLGEVQLRGVHGLLWDGSADQVVGSHGQNLGRLQWQLSRRVILGQTQLGVQFQGPQLSFDAKVAKSGDADTVLDDAHAHIDLALQPAAPGARLGTPRGMLDLQIPHALLQGPWPQQLEAQAQWHAARMQVVAGQDQLGEVAANDVALGELRLELHGQQGVIDGNLRDDGKSPLQVDAQLQASPLGWRFNAVLTLRSSDPALHRWLQQFGTPDAAGAWHVERSGGLAAKSVNKEKHHR